MAKKADGTIRIDVKALTKAYESALKKAGTVSFAFGAIIADVMQRAAAEIAELVPEVMDLRNELTDLEEKSGVAKETLAALRNAARGSGQAFSELAPALSQFPKRLSDVARGTGEAKIAFDALSIEATNADGSLRSADDVLKEFLSKVKKVKDPTTRAALATAAFGEAGGKLLQALGGGELEAHVAFAERYGIEVGPRAAQAASDWQRASAELSTVLDKVKGSIVDTLQPAKFLEDLMLGSVGVYGLLTETWKQAVIVGNMMANTLSLVEFTLRGNFDEVKRLHNANLELNKSIRSPIDGMIDASLEFWKAREEMRKTGEASEELSVNFTSLASDTKTSTTAIKDTTQELARFRTLVTEVNREGISEEEQYTAAILDRIVAIQELGAAVGREAEANAAAMKLLQEHDKELLKMRRQSAHEQIVLEAEIAAYRAEKIAENNQKAKEAQREQMEQAQSYAAATMQIGSMVGDMLSESAAQQAKLGKEGKKRARVQFQVAKGLAMGEAIMNVATAVTQVLPNFILAGLIAAAGAVQVAKIGQQKPNFHIGTRASKRGALAPDETQATLTEREIVLTPQGAAAANAGIVPTQKPSRYVLQFGTDFFDASVRTVQHTGGRFAQAVAGRSRVGHRVAR